MLQMWKLLLLRNRMLRNHRTGKYVVSLLAWISVAVAVFLVLSHQLQSVPEVRVILLVSLILAGSALLGLVVTAVNSVRTWFKSSDAFFLITKPFSVKQMYWYHLADFYEEFFRAFGHLILPPLAVLGLKLGVIGLIVILVLFFGLLSLSVGMGFFIIFYYLYNKKRPIYFVPLALIIGLSSGLMLYLWRISPLITVIILAILVVPFHLLVQSYIDRVFHVCLDASNASLTVRVNRFTGRMLKKTFLFNRRINSVLRAVIYKELVTEERNWFKYIRYLAVIGFLLLYLPLSKMPVFVQGGLAADLIYCHLVMVLNVHDGFASIFAKEGDKLVLLWPHAFSWRMGWGKFIAAIIMILPLVFLTTGFIWMVNSFSLLHGLSFGISLLLLSAAHMAVVIVIGTRFLNLENRDSDLLSGILWEQTCGNLNPGILSGFTASLLVPALYCFALYGIENKFTQSLFFENLCFLNLIAVIFIGIIMISGKVLYSRKMKSLI